MQIHDGCIEIPERAGTGFSFDQDAIRHFELA
jgi:L-alanine-DL-glutamate epimerase-like enolase superfamily enzyme